MTTTSNTAVAPQKAVIDHKTSASMRQRQLTNKITTYVLLTIAGLLFGFPLFWTASSSLQTWQELRSYTPHLLPEVAHWENYNKVFESVPFARWMLNSFLIVLLTVAVVDSTVPIKPTSDGSV